MSQLPSAMVLLRCFVAQKSGVMFFYLISSGARVGDNIVFVREPGNPFNLSCVKVGLLLDSCVCIFWVHLEAKVTSIINPLGTLPENAVKCSVFCILCNYYVIFVTSR